MLNEDRESSGLANEPKPQDGARMQLPANEGFDEAKESERTKQ